MTAACLAISYPTAASAPHMLINGFKNLVAVAAETEIEFKEATTFKEYLKVNNMLFFIVYTYYLQLKCYAFTFILHYLT